jgi:hypothetical protein
MVSLPAVEVSVVMPTGTVAHSPKEAEIHIPSSEPSSIFHPPA